MAKKKEKEKFIRTKVHSNIGTIGYVDHGKTTLIAAITYALSLKDLGDLKDYEAIDKSPEGNINRMKKNTTFVKKETNKRHYSNIECPGHQDYIKNMITGASQMEGANLEVAASDVIQVKIIEKLKKIFMWIESIWKCVKLYKSVSRLENIDRKIKEWNIMLFNSTSSSFYPNFEKLVSITKWMKPDKVNLFRVSKCDLARFKKEHYDNSGIPKKDAAFEEEINNKYVEKTFNRHFSTVVNYEEISDNIYKVRTLGWTTKQHFVKQKVYCSDSGEYITLSVLYYQVPYVSREQAHSTVITETIMSAESIEKGMEEGNKSLKEGKPLEETMRSIVENSEQIKISDNEMISNCMYKSNIAWEEENFKWEKDLD